MFKRRRATSEEIKAFLDRLRDDLEPIKSLAEGYLSEDAWIDEDSGALLLGHAPDIAPEAFHICLFPSLCTDLATTISPSKLGDILGTFNGADVLRLRIFGQIENFTRSARQPLDLGMGAIWSVGYKGARAEEALFAAQNVSWDGQVGYFMAEDGSIVGRPNDGEVPNSFMRRWTGVADWLASVLPVNTARDQPE